jgi:Fic-DOC domain mobile mystery protein B
LGDPLVPTDGASTPIRPSEREGLIPTWIGLKRELDEVEAAGVGAADQWAFGAVRDVLDEAALLHLHRRMFGEVWTWAGRLRDTERNIGAAPHLIAMQLRQLIDDARYWRDHQVHAPDELAVRFHHRLVLIHPFVNGNGRHARLAADLLVRGLGGERFTWGRESLRGPGDVRARYVAALKAADAHDIAPLLAFARS